MLGMTSFNKRESLSIFQVPRTISCAPAGVSPGMSWRDIATDLPLRGTRVRGHRRLESLGGSYLDLGGGDRKEHTVLGREGGKRKAWCSRRAIWLKHKGVGEQVENSSWGRVLKNVKCQQEKL